MHWLLLTGILMCSCAKDMDEEKKVYIKKSIKEEIAECEKYKETMECQSTDVFVYYYVLGQEEAYKRVLALLDKDPEDPED